MTNKANNTQQKPKAANMILYGGAFDGQMITVDYQERLKGTWGLPGAISIPVERKVIAPRHALPVNETYVLRDLQFSKNVKFQVYVAKGVSMEQFFTMLLQNYKPGTGK